MLGRLRLGSAMTVALSVCFLVVRIYMIRSYDAQGVTPHASLIAARPAYPAAPLSSWVIFATNDQATQVRIQHARLLAEPPQDPATPAPMPGKSADFLELTGVAHGHADAVLTLASVPAATCFAIDHVDAAFDNRQPHDFAAEPGADNGRCALKIEAFDQLLGEILNAQMLVMTPKVAGIRLKDAAFRVGGLSWDMQ